MKRTDFIIVFVIAFVLLMIKTTSISIAQTFQDDSLAVISLLELNGVDSMYVCGNDDTRPTNTPCFKPICVDSLVTVHNGRVVSLHFSDQFASGTRRPAVLGSEIVHITELESLFLEADYLDSLPDELSQLKQLKFLHLLGNKFTSFPEVICSITGLKYLDLTGALFTSLPASISKLTNLEAFYIGATNLTTIPPEIGDLTNLKVLRFGSPIQELPPTIGRLHNLSVLRLDFCELNSLPDEIGNLINLGQLDVSNNYLVKLPETFGNLTHLNLLFLADNQLRTLPNSIVNITNNDLLCFITGNKICDPSEPVKNWLDTHCGNWKWTQKGCPANTIQANPAKKPIHCETLTSIEIFDLKGRRINTSFPMSSLKRPNLPHGIYLLKLKPNEGRELKRIVVGK